MLLNWMLPVLIIHLQTGASEQTEILPDFIIACDDDPNLVTCPAQLLERLRHRLVQGIPEFRLPPIDPLVLKQVTVARRGSTIADYATNVTNNVWTGAGGFEILETLVNPNVLVFRLKLRFPYLHASGDVTAEGRLLGFDLSGSGDFSCNATNVVLDIVLNGKLYESEGREFLIWAKEDIEIDYDDFYFLYVHGVLVDPTMSHIFTAALNKGIRLIGTTTKSFIRDSIGNFIFEAINLVHSLYPSDVLYPRS